MTEEKFEDDKNGDLEEQPMLSSNGSSLCDYTKSLWNGHLILATLAAVFGSSFQFGYNTGVINAPEVTIKQFYNETHFSRYGNGMDSYTLTVIWGFTVSIFAVGGMIGSYSAGYLANKLGRKGAMYVNNIPAIIAAILMGCTKVANSYEILIVGRFIIGINCGVNTGLAPLYLTEIAPTTLRGQLGTLNQMGIVSAMLLSQVLGLPAILGSENNWPILLAFTAVFSLYQLLVLPFCPESPKYLVKKKRYEEAIIVLQWLRKRKDVSSELEEAKKEELSASQQETYSIRELFTIPNLRKPMIIAIVMQLSQQFSGINAVFYYSTSLFEKAGISQQYAGYGTVGMGVCNVCMTAISVALIEKAGRRLLHLVGLAGMFVCSIVLTISMNMVTNTLTWASIVALIAVFLFVAAFQTGPGAIPWFITAELFNQSARSAAISVAGLVNWTGNFVVGLGYPPLVKLIHGYVFLVFAGLLAIFWLFTYFRVPETKGKSIDEITAKFNNN